MQEAKIEINGVELTEGQSMALRVAVTNFHSQNTNDPDRLGTDDMGRALTKGYRERSADVLPLIHGTLIR